MADTDAPDMRWLSMIEAAQALGASARTIQRRVAAGEIPASGEGRSRRYMIDMSASKVATASVATANGVAALSAVVVTLGATAAETRHLAQVTLDGVRTDAQRWQAEAARSGRRSVGAWIVAAAAGIALAASVTAWLSATKYGATAAAEAILARAEARQASERLDGVLRLLGDLRVKDAAMADAPAGADCAPADPVSMGMVGSR